MDHQNITQRNGYISRLQRGEPLSEPERRWLFQHPILSDRYDAPWIIADMLPLQPGKLHMVTVQCQYADEAHPIIPTFTIPFETGGFLQLAGVVESGQAMNNMPRNTKQSMRMIAGITAGLRCRSESGLLMVSYQGWVPDHQPIPRWFESIRCNRFAMRREIVNDNMVVYHCRGADGAENRFQFLVNWYAIE